MAEVFDLLDTDASNTGRWPEGMLGGDINNAGRADEGMLARHYHDHDGSRTASGSSNAFSVTPVRTIAALFNNLTQVFTANHTITGAATLNLSGLGAKSIKRFNGSELTAGDIVSGLPVWVIYKLATDTWYMVSAAAALFANMHADFNENGSPGDPAANVARLYAFEDTAGRTRLAYRDNGGLFTVLGYQGELIAIIEDRKAQNTAAQTLTSGSDQVRELTTLVFNRDTMASLSSNRFTLPAGTWRIAWQAPVSNTNLHQSFLYNQTDAAEVARGSSGKSEGGSGIVNGPSLSMGSAVVTIASAKAFEIRHRVQGTSTGGFPANFGTEVYTRVEVWRA